MKKFILAIAVATFVLIADIAANASKYSVSTSSTPGATAAKSTTLVALEKTK
ncbi:MAG: hypothetical protein V4478_01040 [Patescibacteria group bacterium]